jgi:para-aminobenzoate synthetase component I
VTAATRPMTTTPEAVFHLLHQRRGAVWLDGGQSKEGWSIIAFDPSEIVTNGHNWPRVGRYLTTKKTRLEASRAGDTPFAGGCLGYVGYGAGHYVDRVPPGPPSDEPEIWLGRFDGGMCYRHCDQTWHVAGASSFCRTAEQLIAAAEEIGEPEAAVRPKSVKSSIERDSYEEAVGLILTWLEGGDCYQINLTRAITACGVGNPWPAYRRLRRISGASHGAFIQLGERAVLSNSPELFMKVRGRRFLSDPIKGTRPRHDNPEEDRRLSQELLRSQKDQAELTMIVDLVRNDMGRVAAAGTVRVQPRCVTAHANVHHTSQIVEALLDDAHDAWSALGAAFPPGSVTGAPKTRACRRIAELEAAPRGVYCGMIGYVADGGDATWSVAIRTALWKGNQVRFHVGGGIVAASDPSEEWNETVDKGRAMARAFCG